MRVIWSNVVLYIATVAAMIWFGNTQDGNGWLSLLTTIVLWVAIFVTYQVGYNRGANGKSDGYFLERVDTRR